MQLEKSRQYVPGIAARAAVLLLVASWSSSAVGQVELLRFEHLTVNEGLSQSSINALVQDHRGFLWVGTQDGLNRFDGYRFEVMRNDPTDPRSLGNNNVSSLFEDSSGVLWVGTTSGTLHRYDRNTHSFDHYRPEASESGSEDFSVDIRDIAETDDGRLWVGTATRGLFSFDRDSQAFTPVVALGTDRINKLHVGTNGDLWIGQDRLGVRRYRPTSGELFTVFSPDADDGDLSISTIVETRNDELWAAGNSGVIWRIRADGTLAGRLPPADTASEGDGAVRAMLEDRQGRIWVGMIGGGLRVFSPSGQQLAVFTHSVSDPYSLSTSTVYALLQDSAGVLWVGSLAAGLSKATLGVGGFTNYRHVPEDPASLSHNMVNEFAEDASGGIWVGSSGGGVSFFRPGAAGFSNFRANPGDNRH